MLEDGTVVEACPGCDGKGTVRMQYGRIGICPDCGGECFVEHECGDESDD